MNNFSITYQFDPLGVNPANKITEYHSLAVPGDKDFHFFIPRSAPFFGDSTRLKITHVDSNTVLTDGVDFVKSHYFFAASRNIGMGVYGSISIRRRTLSGSFKVEYHTLGGEWVMSETAIVEYIANFTESPRTVYWDSIQGVPEKFPVIDHFHDINQDLTGVGALEDQLIIMNQTLRQSLKTNARSGRNELPPVRSVYNSNNQLITLQESWTQFARVALKIEDNKWITNLSFRLTGGRINGAGLVSPTIECQINFQAVPLNGLMSIESMSKKNINPEGIHLRVYGVVEVLKDIDNNDVHYLQLYLRDKQLRSAVQILDMSEFRLIHLLVPYHEKLDSVITQQPVGVVEFNTVT